MKKRLFRLVAILLTLAVYASLFSGVSLALQEDTGVSPAASSYFSYYSVTASNVSGKLRVIFSVTSPSTMDELGVSVLTIQKKNSSGTWYTYSTYDSDDINMINTNASYCSRSIDFSNISSGTYRAVLRFYACDNNNSESHILYSSQVSFP